MYGSFISKKAYWSAGIPACEYLQGGLEARTPLLGQLLIRMHVVVRHCRGEKIFARIKTCKFFNVLVNANREENVPEKQKCP